MLREAQPPQSPQLPELPAQPRVLAEAPASPGPSTAAMRRPAAPRTSRRLNSPSTSTGTMAPGSPPRPRSHTLASASDRKATMLRQVKPMSSQKSRTGTARRTTAPSRPGPATRHGQVETRARLGTAGARAAVGAEKQRESPARPRRSSPNKPRSASLPGTAWAPPKTGEPSRLRRVGPAPARGRRRGSEGPPRSRFRPRQFRPHRGRPRAPARDGTVPVSRIRR